MEKGKDQTLTHPCDGKEGGSTLAYPCDGDREGPKTKPAMLAGCQCLNSGCFKRRSEILYKEEAPNREPTASHLCEVCMKTRVGLFPFSFF